MEALARACALPSHTPTAKQAPPRSGPAHPRCQAVLVPGGRCRVQSNISRFGIFQTGFYGRCVTRSLHSPLYQDLRQLLVQARAAAGLTQVELASRLERPQSFVSKFETAERRLDVIEFIEVCRALGVSPSKLLRKLAE